MKQTPLEEKITKIIDPVVTDQGLRLVAIKIIGSDGGQTVQIMAEDPDTKNLGIDACMSLSREISTLFDVEDPISGNYRLEVSSPGIDRPLVTLQDFADFKGYEAKVEVMPPIAGQKKFRGRLKGLEGENIIIDTDLDEHSLPFDAIQKAKLVLTEELIQKSKKKAS